MNGRPKQIRRVLTPNDTGETGGHQAGILVPKAGDVLKFFPDLGNATKNPRTQLIFEDEDGTEWEWTFIYYNNKFFDEHGTRNEYRLTGMTKYIRSHALKSGDTIILTHEKPGLDTVKCIHAESAQLTEYTDDQGRKKEKLVVKLDWTVTKY